MKFAVKPKHVLIGTSVMSSLSTYHQVHKIRTQKCAKNISILNVSTVWTNMMVNFVYATNINNKRLMLTFGNSTLSLSWFLANTLYYKLMTQ